MIRFCKRILKGKLFFLGLQFKRRHLSYVIKEEVKNALTNGLPVVALESTIISHGMPFPRNIEVALAVESVVRESGAIPATIAIIDGVPKIGLSAEEIMILADSSRNVMKASRKDIAYAMANKCTAATTVASTMFLAHKAGIQVFATGGIGGVHRGAEITMDISADLVELGRTPVTVVCGGVKSILDIEKTLEFLETQGVPVLGYKCKEFPAFFTNKSGINSPFIAKDAEEIARMINIASIMQLTHGIVVAVQNPLPADSKMIQQAIDDAVSLAKVQGISGYSLTPYLLSVVERSTLGRSLDSNIALVLNNAKVASQIAFELSKIRQNSSQVGPDNLELPEPVQQQPTLHLLSNDEKNTTSDVTAPPASSIICVGGAVVDMIGSVSSRLILKSSNPGRMRMTYGGVIFNISQHLARSQNPCHRVELISALGSDNYGLALLNHAKSIGINTVILEQISADIQSQRKELVPMASSNQKSLNTATYTAIHGPDGDLCVAVADMDIFQLISSKHINELSGRIRHSDIVVCDANISAEAFSTLSNIAQTYLIPVFFEPTSDHKCVLPIRAKSLSKIDVLKPNVSELIVMSRACLEHSLIIRNKALIQNTLLNIEAQNRITGNSSDSVTASVDINDVRVLASGILHAMLSGPQAVSFRGQSHSEKSPRDNQLTSEGRIRRIHGKHIIISMGPHGVLWCGSKHVLTRDKDAGPYVSILDDEIASVHIPAIPVDPEDIIHTSGAGDAFCSGLISSLFETPRSVGPSARGIHLGLQYAVAHLRNKA